MPKIAFVYHRHSSARRLLSIGFNGKIATHSHWYLNNKTPLLLTLLFCTNVILLSIQKLIYDMPVTVKVNSNLAIYVPDILWSQMEIDKGSGLFFIICHGVLVISRNVATVGMWFIGLQNKNKKTVLVFKKRPLAFPSAYNPATAWFHIS